MSQTDDEDGETNGDSRFGGGVEPEMPSEIASSSADSAHSCAKSDPQNESTKKRSCARKLSSIPNQKYLCQKDSGGFQSSYDSGANDMAGNSMEMQDCNEVFTDNFEITRDESVQCHLSSCKLCQNHREDEHHKNGDLDSSHDSDCVCDGEELLHNGVENWEPQTPSAVYSWGHFSKCVKNRYKYRRSDYSSDSEDEASAKRNLLNDPQYCNGSVQQKSHLPACDNLLTINSVNKDAQTVKTDSIKALTSRPRDGVKPTVFKEKLAVS